MPTCMEKFLRQHLPDAPMHVIQEATARDIRSKQFSCYNMLWSFHVLFGQPLRASVSLYGFTRCLAGGGRANTDNRAATLMPMPPACTYDICITTNTKVAVPSLEAVPAKSRPVKSIDGDHHVQIHKVSTWGTVLPRASATSCMTCSSGWAPGSICRKRADLGPSGSVSLSYFPA